jgi:tetratricopeptide (TPR) repeat protein
VGYGGQPDKHLEKIQKAVNGVDTYKSLNEQYANNPNDVAVDFKLALKCASRYTPEMTARSKELYRKVIALDPEGKQGSYSFEFIKATVPYTQAAEFELGRDAAYDRKPDPAPMQAFIKKYPESPLLKEAYSSLGYYFQNFAPEKDATKFFEEYTANYPEDPQVLNAYVERIIKDKSPLDKGIELAEKVKEIVGYPQNPDYEQNLAQLYVLKGDPGKAEEEYGKSFLDSYISTAVYTLTGYANFWLDQGKNLDSAEAAADLAVKTAPASPTRWYTLQSAADIYMKLNKTDKALAVYGPEFIKANADDQSILASYASFWNRQDKNLDSALEAATKSVDLRSDYYNNFTLANILFKLKKYDEALKPAEKALELAKAWAVKYPGYATQRFETLVKKIKDAIAKEKGVGSNS